MLYQPSLVIATLLYALASLPTAGDPSSAKPKPVLAREAYAVLKSRCFACHGENGVANAGVFVLDHGRLLKETTVIPGDTASNLLKQVESGAMPPRGNRLPADEVRALKQWITAGAPDWESERPGSDKRNLWSEAEICRQIETDLRKEEPRSRPYQRYFSIAHLSSAEVSEQEIAVCRIALAKLLNSLSWHPEISRPKAINPEGMILRIDLRDYLWTSETWKTLLAIYPYATQTDVGQRIETLSGTTAPYIRADWFVANASLPPLYHAILDLPSTVSDLEHRLNVDSKRDFEQERNIARGGMRKSGVSSNNRVVERHVSAYGAYWKTFDFAGNSAEQNIFLNPVDLKPAGGEMIFSLPNGMQAYFLAKGDGQRLDAAPIAIVGDRNYPDDPEVHNGRSCMSCHSEGMKTFKDDVRGIVERQENAAFDKDKALALYQPQSKLDSLLAKDRIRFRQAVEQTGGRASGDFRSEPINAVSRRFRSELTIARAAAEAGMDEDVFKALVRKSPRLMDLGYGQLLVSNGGMKRDAWEDYFTEMQQELDRATRPAQTIASYGIPLLYDGCDYRVGVGVSGLNGGSGKWGGPWDQYGPAGTSSLILRGSLSFGHLATSGNSIMTMTDSPVGHGRAFGAPAKVGATGSTLFISFLVKPLDGMNAGSPYTYFMLVIGEVGIGKDQRTGYYALESGNGTVNVAKVLAATNETAFLVVRLKFTDGADRFDLWVNPTPGRPLPVNPDATKVDMDIGIPAGFNLGSSIRTVFDEIRFGTTWESVSPVN